MQHLDMQVTLLAVLALSPTPFRASIASDGSLSKMQNWLCDLIESARHKKFISMISTAVD